MDEAFTAEDRASVYRAIEARRDVRSFRRDRIPPDVLNRILGAAHHAPSVGFMQPWNFILVQSPTVKALVKAMFLRENQRAQDNYSGDRRRLYDALKLEGIEDAPLNLCVTCDRSRGGPHVLGRNTIVETDIYSTCCAVQNLWLAARVEGIGVGWVSILDPRELCQILALPDHVIPVAYLCLGYAREFLDQPELQERGWERRVPLEALVFQDRWNECP